ncbi:MAG: hypothetical protein ACI4MH_06955 [Candidatus Coproplasma sp.]
MKIIENVTVTLNAKQAIIAKDFLGEEIRACCCLLSPGRRVALVESGQGGLRLLSAADNGSRE